MPIELRYDRKQGVLYSVVTSPITLEEFGASMARIIQSDDYPPDVRTLWDLRELDFEPVYRPFEEQVIDIRQKFPERGAAKIALVVASDLGFGMTRMYEILSNEMPQNVMVFRNCEEGEKWLLAE